MLKGADGIGFGTAETMGGEPGDFEHTPNRSGRVQKKEAAAAFGDGLEGLQEEADPERGDEARLGQVDQDDRAITAAEGEGLGLDRQSSGHVEVAHQFQQPDTSSNFGKGQFHGDDRTLDP